MTAHNLKALFSAPAPGVFQELEKIQIITRRVSVMKCIVNKIVDM